MKANPYSQLADGAMEEIPDDLTTHGTHRGGPPPEETGQTVRSPTGPDPGGESARTKPAVYQFTQHTERGHYRVRVHSARTVDPPVENGYEEIGRYDTPEDLRTRLGELPKGPYTLVFEDEDAGELFVRDEQPLTHRWLGKPRFDAVTLFTDAETATRYVDDRRSDLTLRA